MPYQILKKGKEYILKSPTKQYKHKTLAKAKAQKRLLEEKEGKVVQTQKVSQKVTVIVNAPKRRAGQARKQTVPQAQTVIAMRPVVPSNPMEAYYATARPQPRSLLSGDEERIKSIEENIRKLREPFLQKQTPNLDRVPSRPVLDTEFFSRQLEKEYADLMEDFTSPTPPREMRRTPQAEEIQPLTPMVSPVRAELVSRQESGGPRTGVQRRLTTTSVFDNATIGQILEGNYGLTTAGKKRTEPTAYQLKAIDRYEEQLSRKKGEQ